MCEALQLQDVVPTRRIRLVEHPLEVLILPPLVLELPVVGEAAVPQDLAHLDGDPGHDFSVTARVVDPVERTARRHVQEGVGGGSRGIQVLALTP